MPIACVINHHTTGSINPKGVTLVSSSILTISSHPYIAAYINGVLPSGPTESGFALSRSSNIFATSILPPKYA